jgi:hypothetical protein
MMRFAQINNKCDLDGQVPVDVGAFRFAIHRRIFAGALPLKPHGRVDPRCSDVPLQGDGVLLVVSATRSGATFYKQWVHGRRFPHCITIRLRGTIKRYPSDRFERLAKSDLKNHPLRFSVISDGLHTLYNASSLRMVDHFNRGIVFECVNTETAKARSCGTSYPLTDDFDLAYEFFMSELGPESWADLDTRVREFVATLIRPKT